MTAGGKGACVQLAACVGEQRHRAPFGLVGIQYFLGRGEGGGVPVDVEGRGEKEGTTANFQTSSAHADSSFIQAKHPHPDTLSTTSRTYLAAAPRVLYLPHPALRLPIHRAAHPNPIFRSRCCRPPTLPAFPLPPKQPSTEPRQIRPERTYLPGPKPLQVRFPPGLFGRLPNAHHLPIILDTSDQTTLPPVQLGCCCLAPGHRPPRPRRSNPRPDTTKNPYSLPGVASFRLQRHFLSLRNLPNSLSFLILRPPPFSLRPPCAAVLCCAAMRCRESRARPDPFFV